YSTSDRSHAEGGLTMTELKQHPLSALFPPMPPEEFRELVEDIRRQGVLEPIELLDGMVFEGCHRYLACQKLAIEAPMKAGRQQNGSETAFANVWAKNALRRHLTRAQRIDVVRKARPDLWEIAGTQQGKSGGHPTTTSAGPAKVTATKAVADLAGVR